MAILSLPLLCSPCNGNLFYYVLYLFFYLVVQYRYTFSHTDTLKFFLSTLYIIMIKAKAHLFIGNANRCFTRRWIKYRFGMFLCINNTILGHRLTLCIDSSFRNHQSCNFLRILLWLRFVCGVFLLDLILRRWSWRVFFRWMNLLVRLRREASELSI